MLSHAKCPPCSPALRRRDDLDSDVNADCRAPTRCDETRHFGFRRSRTGAPDRLQRCEVLAVPLQAEGSEQSDFPWGLPFGQSCAGTSSCAPGIGISWRAASIRGRLSAPIGVNPKLITRSVTRSLPRFQKIGINVVRPHDLRRTGRTELARLGVSKHIAERVLNHSKDVIEGTYHLYE